MTKRGDGYGLARLAGAGLLDFVPKALSTYQGTAAPGVGGAAACQEVHKQ